MCSYKVAIIISETLQSWLDCQGLCRTGEINGGANLSVTKSYQTCSTTEQQRFDHSWSKVQQTKIGSLKEMIKLITAEKGSFCGWFTMHPIGRLKICAQTILSSVCAGGYPFNWLARNLFISLLPLEALNVFD
jgi:hypothetical protein